LATVTHTPLAIAVVGAGMGGLTAASTLRLFDRKPRTSRIQAIASATDPVP